jgi:hypothetical protein
VSSNMKKYISILLFSFFFCFLGITSFAQTPDSFSTKTITTTDDVQKIEEEIKGIQSDGGLPKTTIEDAENWVDRKGFELIHLLQKFAQPFAIIIFILSAFTSLVGAFGNSHLVGRGFFGMFIAVIMYAVALYAPELMDAAVGWLTS